MSRLIKPDSIQTSGYSGNFIDNFNNSSINPIWQQNLGASNLGSFTEDSTKLTLTYPSGTSTEFYNGVYTAPRLFFLITQDVNFDIIVFVSNMISTSNYASTGVLLYNLSDSSVFHRFDLGYSSGIQIRAIYNSSTITAPSYPNTYAWMRYRLRGSTLSYMYSANTVNNPPRATADWTLLHSRTLVTAPGNMVCGLFSSSVGAMPGVSHYFQNFSLSYGANLGLIGEDTTSDVYDKFNNSSIDTIWSMNTGLSSLGTFTEDSTKLTISYPSGATDWWDGTYNNPQVYVARPGERDFSVSAYISNIASVNNTGFINIYSSVNSGQFHKAGIANIGGTTSFYFQYGIANTLGAVANTSGRGWVRIIKNGATLFFFYKDADFNNKPADGDWVLAYTLAYIGDPTKMIVSLQASNNGAAVNTYFQDFRFEYLNSKRYSIYNSTEYANKGDKPPTVSNAKDDEFNGTALDAKWTWIRAGAPSGTRESVVVSGSNLIMRCGLDSGGGGANPNEAHMISQAVPAGDWAITTKISAIPRSDYNSAGVFCDDGTNSNVNMNVFCASGFTSRTENNRYNAGVFSASNFASTHSGSICYLGMMYTSATQVHRMLVSQDGVNWSDCGNWTSTWTPTRFGLLVWTQNTTYYWPPVLFDWFRVATSIYIG